MDVPTVAQAGSSPGEGPNQTQPAAAPQATAAVAHSSSTSAQAAQPSQGESTLASVVAKLYNVTQGSSGQPATLSVSYKYVNQLQLVVTVFTNPQTGEEWQFPPQELIGLAEMFDKIDGVTLDQKA